MTGRILEKGQEYYTFMDSAFLPIRDEVKKFNWLISNCDIHYYPDNRIGNPEYDWISGEDLLEIVEKYRIQFVWGVFSAFDKTIPLNEILKTELPWADCNGEIWNLPIQLQHPLAEIEIISFDSGCTVFKSKNDNLVSIWGNHFEMSDDFEEKMTELNKHKS